MQALDHEFGLLATSVERTVAVQQEAARVLLDAAPAHGQALARHLVRAYEEVAAHVGRRRAGYESLPDEDSKRGAVTEMRSLLEGARDLHVSLSWLDAARTPPLDLGTRYLIDFIASRLVSARAEVTVVTAVEGSYRTAIDPFSFVFSNLEEQQVDELAIVVFVPRREQHSGLLHPLIVHELGHAASKQGGLAQSLTAKTESDDSLRKLLDTSAHALAAEMDMRADVMTAICKAVDVAPEPAPESEAVSSVARGYLMLQLGYWVEEALCDAFATQLLGPTYLYAFAAIVGTGDLDATDAQHPPARQRMRLMLAQLDALGWEPILAKETPEIGDWLRDKSTTSLRHQEPAHRFCLGALELLMDDVRGMVAEHVGQLAFEPAAFDAARSEEIKSLLAAGVPPAQAHEVGTAQRRKIGRAEIILGSWLFALGEGGGGLDALARAPGLPELSRLLPKALELSALVAAWDSENDAAS